jgi:hypothetical protein
MLAACPAHFTFIDLITLIPSWCEEYKLLIFLSHILSSVLLRRLS